MISWIEKPVFLCAKKIFLRCEELIRYETHS